MTTIISRLYKQLLYPKHERLNNSVGKPIYTFKSFVFVILHFLPFLVFFLPDGSVKWWHFALCIFLYFFRMFFVTAGYHRYFSHRSFKLNRFMQFVFAFFSQTTAQKGVLWWASKHRHHHRYSDTLEDFHSTQKQGFFWAHVGWLIDSRNDLTDYDLIKDLSRFKELQWLNKYYLVPAFFLGICVFFLGLLVQGTIYGAISSLLIGFLLSTCILYHGTFTINSLTHSFGKKRYKTADNSRNNFFFALITLGEGWHNNHHYYESSCRQGFYWWEIDITYYGIYLLNKLGLVKKIHNVSLKTKLANQIH